ncbi:MAG: hypothetical protein ACFFB4_16120 [Promethearchaeota archaeon]
MSIRRKNFIGFIIGTFFVAGISGGFIGYIFPRIIEEGVFNVSIDGNFNAGEGWQYSDWQFIEYLLVDNEDLNTHNFFYIHLAPNSLYILIDFASDITNDTTDEFLSVWIDTDNSLSEFPTDESWNSQITNPGQELLCFIPEAGTINDTLYIADLVFPVNDLIYLTTLNESNSIVKFGFQSSINSPYLHRIFEIEIDRAALRGLNSTNFNFGFLGYGTVYIPIYTELGIWGAPTLFVSDFYDRSRWIREQTFFKCGYGVEM